MTVDTDGNRVTKSVRRDRDGTWSANVWFGSGCVTTVRRYYSYPTRAAARNADISDTHDFRRKEAV
jgi:hypothetical protein